VLAAGLFGRLGGLEIREALRQRRVVLVDGVQCEPATESNVSRVALPTSLLEGRRGVNILRLARSREEGLLAGVADDAHGSGVLRVDYGSDGRP
jgi:hypothetical protein